MFKIDPYESYSMPIHFGPRYKGPKTSGWYRDVTMMAVPYVTDHDALSKLLPAPFEVADVPVITVFYACNKNIDWLAGHGYNLLGVNASVRYQGKEETLEGSYTLVMWENLADPILTGRELQGIPKIYADIPEHSITENRWQVGASHFGHSIVDLNINDVVTPTAEQIAAGQEAQKDKDNPMGLRFIPAVGGYGKPVDIQPTIFPSESTYTDVKIGEGEVVWKELTWEQNPTQFHIVNTLKALPILGYLPAVITHGSTNLIVPENLPRALK